MYESEERETQRCKSTRIGRECDRYECAITVREKIRCSDPRERWLRRAGDRGVDKHRNVHRHRVSACAGSNRAQ